MRRLLIVVTLVCVLSGAALAGEMPGGGRSATGDMPIVGKTTGEMPGVGSPQPVPGDMPGGGSAILSETESGLVTTVLFMLITLIGR